jgi:hypothetical protein
LGSALTAAEQGDGTALAGLATSYDAAGDYVPYLAVLCADGERPEGSEEWRTFAAGLTEVAPRLGAAVANEVLPCAFWPVPPTRDPSPPAPVGLVSVLVVGTTGDVVTPYEEAVQVAENLPGAVLLTHEGEGHTASGSRCVGEAVRRYLVDLRLPESGTICSS